jgi:hypothetical protein
VDIFANLGWLPALQDSKWFGVALVLTLGVAYLRRYLDYRERLAAVQVELRTADRKENAQDLKACLASLAAYQEARDSAERRGRQAENAYLHLLRSISGILPPKTPDCPSVCPARADLPRIIEERIAAIQMGLGK